MMTARPRLAFICNPETKILLKEWAKRENRTISNLIETIVETAIAQRQIPLSDNKIQDSQRRT